MRLAAVLLLVLSTCAAVPAYAQDQPDQGTRVEPGWTFEEEEEVVPTWADDLRAQAVDLVAVSIFTVFAFVSFFRKSERLTLITLVAAVGYLGFYKSQLISIVNIFGLVGGNLPLVRHNLAWYFLAVVVVVSTVLWGRVYCGRICAFGALTQLMDRVLPARWRVNVPRAIERRASLIKYGILAGAIAYFVATGDPLIYPYIEPFWMFGLQGKTPVLWIGLGALLITTVFVRNVVLPVSLPRRRGAWHRLAADDGVPDQALVRVQHLPDLREEVRVGRDSRAEDRAERMRPLR